MTMKMNIGDQVIYSGDYGERKTGKLTAVGSDKDSYDDIKLRDGVFLYKSKKLRKYIPIRDKSLSSIYLEITRGSECFDYIVADDLIGPV